MAKLEVALQENSHCLNSHAGMAESPQINNFTGKGFITGSKQGDDGINSSSPCRKSQDQAPFPGIPKVLTGTKIPTLQNCKIQPLSTPFN